jgi:GNAT superfamily N-acetyltransferase
MGILGSEGGDPGTPPGGNGPFVLRPTEADDMAWLVEIHGDLYQKEYGWGEWFREIVAGVVADFQQGFDPRLDRGWIAERDGRRVGSVLLVHHPERAGVARLRVLLVDPSARGLGIGRALVQACSGFARQRGYHTITLWTNQRLTGARRLYEEEGYHLVHQEKHPPFPADDILEVWELPLGPPSSVQGGHRP